MRRSAMRLLPLLVAGASSLAVSPLDVATSGLASMARMPFAVGQSSFFLFRPTLR